MNFLLEIAIFLCTSWSKDISVHPKASRLWFPDVSRPGSCTVVQHGLKIWLDEHPHPSAICHPFRATLGPGSQPRCQRCGREAFEEAGRGRGLREGAWHAGEAALSSCREADANGCSWRPGCPAAIRGPGAAHASHVEVRTTLGHLAEGGGGAGGSDLGRYADWDGGP